jgi:hypothetical protein
LPNLEDLAASETVHADDASISSVVHTPPFAHAKRQPQTVLFSSEVGRNRRRDYNTLTKIGPRPAYIAHGKCQD